MSDKEILKMELDQLKSEVNTARTPVSKITSAVKTGLVLLPSSVDHSNFTFICPKSCIVLKMSIRGNK